MKFKNLLTKVISILMALLIIVEVPFFSKTMEVEAYPININYKAQSVANDALNVEKIVYGYSVNGRDLEAYVINGLGYDWVTILINFSVHGFEDYSWRDGQYLTECANNLVDYISTNSHILKNCRIVIVPCANPDGAIDGVNNKRSGSDAFGRCTADHVDMNRDFINFYGQETRALRDLMIKYDPYIYIDFHGWENSVLGEGFLVDSFRTTCGLETDKTGSFGTSKGYAIGYAKNTIGSFAALVEFKDPYSLNYLDVVKGLEMSISFMPQVCDKWGLGRYGWYYLDSNGNYVKNSWVEDYMSWCYLGWDGTMYTDKWVEDSYGWCYVDSHGHTVTDAWVEDSVTWCYLDSYGHLVTDAWIEDTKGWCYVDSDGHLVTDYWAEDSKGWCYLDETGHLLINNWAMDSKGWCSVDETGHLVTNSWRMDSKGWCYVDETGHLITDSWQKDTKGLCYVDKDGHLVTDKWLDDNNAKKYVDNDGHLVTDTWITDKNGSRYVDKDGKLIVNAWVNDNYFVNENGYKVTNNWVEYEGSRYFLDGDGNKTVGWLNQGKDRYYFFENGKMATGEQTIDGVKYDFGQNGVCKEVKDETTTNPSK